MNKVVKVIVTLIVIAVIVWAVSISKQPKNSSPITVGVITPITGDAASLGEFLKNVTDMAVLKVNNEGGVNGRPINLIYEDDQCNPSKSTSAAQKLISVDGVEVIIGSSCSGAVASFLPMTTQNKVFVFSGAATSPTLTNTSSLFARTVPSDASQGQALADYAIRKGLKKVAIVQEITDYSVSIGNAFAASYTSDKGKILKEEYASQTTDFRTLLLKLKAQNPDAILLIPASPATAVRLIGDYQKLQWNTQILTNDMFSSNSELVASNKAILEGAITAEQKQGPEAEAYVNFKNEYKQKYGKDLPYETYAQAQYDLIHILRDGLKEVGNDAEKLAAWVRTVKNYPGFSGGITIGSDGDRIGGHTLKVIKNGKTESFVN